MAHIPQFSLLLSQRLNVLLFFPASKHTEYPTLKRHVFIFNKVLEYVVR